MPEQGWTWRCVSMVVEDTSEESAEGGVETAALVSCLE